MGSLSMDALTGHWTLLSSHGLVLVYLASRPNATVRETADSLGLSERRVASLIRDLQATGVVRATRVGRRKHYDVDPDAHFRHPAMKHLRLREVLGALRIASGPTPQR
jgi:DNA-binding transcriptional regulator GbsR (MarR family)